MVWCVRIVKRKCGPSDGPACDFAAQEWEWVLGAGATVDSTSLALHGFEFDDASSNNGSVSTAAEGGIAIPPSVCANPQERMAGETGADGFR